MTDIGSTVDTKEPAVKDKKSKKDRKQKDFDPTSIEAKHTPKLNAFLWFTYDAADTYFSQLIISLAFTPFSLLLGILNGWTYETTFIVVSVFMATSNLLIAILGPILGSLSDIAGKRKKAVIMVASIMIFTTAAITLWINFWWACILFLIANFCYQAGRMFYDAQIPFIAKTEQRSFTQAVGGSLSFIGSVLAVVTSMVVGRIFGQWTAISSAIWDAGTLTPADIELGGIRWLFVIGAVVIVLIALPYLFHKEVENPSDVSFEENFRESLNTFRTTGKEIIKDKNSLLFYLGWFFITDAANTAILYMAVTIQGAVGYSKEITDLVIMVGIGGCLVFAVLTGLFMNKFGPKKTFMLNGLSWGIAVTIIMFSGWELGGIITPKWLMFPGAIFIGIGFGGIWIIGRQFIMELAPPSKVAQYGGFQKIAGRVSAIISPLLYAGMIYAFSFLGLNMAYRFALGMLLVFFVIGVIIISFIIDPHERYLKGERAPYEGIYEQE
ncbi:MAG: MFS transporter [Candidatus Heimdallarchaeota archaeon]|nr:MFS transporter [Candidatus Heimdallarchaeota archaeon]